ncbi:hypothetical protein BDR06DRAFT_970593 [Suillus hirtellus]|nr:hypothetical protein BDR06DRAFT_970593 [Suillus hirtellus]
MAQKLSWVYTEWMMGDHAWEMQSTLPRGTTLLGTVLSSDKTYIITLTGLAYSPVPGHHIRTIEVSYSRRRHVVRSHWTQLLLLHSTSFFWESQKFCLNGVAKPFWSDWVLADPDWFLTPESLHIIHKKFWNHDVQWLILAVGESEIDF